jgi:hypothetical protein
VRSSRSDTLLARYLTDYAVVTKGTSLTLASLQPSREEAAEFWCELTPEAGLAHALDLMNDAEHKPATGCCLLLVDDDSACPTL